MNPPPRGLPRREACLDGLSRLSRMVPGGPRIPPGRAGPSVIALQSSVLGLLFAYLGLSWRLLARSWPRLGPSWHNLGPSWLHLGPSWRLLGVILALLWPILAQSWPIFATSWLILAPSWPNFAPKLEFGSENRFPDPPKSLIFHWFFKVFLAFRPFQVQINF